MCVVGGRHFVVAKVEGQIFEPLACTFVVQLCDVHMLYGHAQRHEQRSHCSVREESPLTAHCVTEAHHRSMLMTCRVQPPQAACRVICPLSKALLVFGTL